MTAISEPPPTARSASIGGFRADIEPQLWVGSPIMRNGWGLAHSALTADVAWPLPVWDTFGRNLSARIMGHTTQKC
jgi:hypothetical protein